jgi:hypothetical protein
MPLSLHFADAEPTIAVARLADILLEAIRHEELRVPNLAA